MRLGERYGRQVSTFARWWAVMAAADPAARQAVDQLCLEIASGRLSGRDLAAALEYLNGLLMDELDRPPPPTPEPT